MERQSFCFLCKETLFFPDYISCRDCNKLFHVECAQLPPDMDINLDFRCPVCDLLNRSLDESTTRLDVACETISKMAQEWEKLRGENYELRKKIMDSLMMLTQIISLYMMNHSKSKPFTAKFGTNLYEKLPLAKKPVKRLALFVSRLAPDTTVEYLSNYLTQNLNLRTAVVNRIRTRFPSYASFHVMLDDWEYSIAIRPEVWPSGVLIQPFFGSTFHNYYKSDDNPPPPPPPGGSAGICN